MADPSVFAASVDLVDEGDGRFTRPPMEGIGIPG